MKKTKLKLTATTLRILGAVEPRRVQGGLTGDWHDCSHSCNTCEGCSIDVTICRCLSLGNYC
jgi:hypothetical protein